jgi:amino acid transporter
MQIGTFAGMPVFGLDALGSAAYGPEAALTLLMPLGAAGIAYFVPVSAGIIVLLAIVSLSYRQTIAAYPDGGGSYTVAEKNLGTFSGLVAAAALMIDYVLVAAVGISSGVGALVSAVPILQPYTLLLCVGTLTIITLVSLRGVRETGLAFMLPTYVFVVSLLSVIFAGVVKTILAGGHPAPIVAPPPATLPTVSSASFWMLLLVFSNGCTAMTGVEAVSNGVRAFREPSVRIAQRTHMAIMSILIAMLAGVAILVRAYGISATVPGQPGYQSVLSMVTAAVAGRGWFYYVTVGAVMLVLALSANTGFADLPRLCKDVAQKGFLPRWFEFRSRRIVYSHGVVFLAALTGILLVAFRGVTDRLIPLFAIGAFLAFTMSQAGMAAHWKRVGGKGAAPRMLVNALGALGTATALIVVLVAKFTSGAWVSAFLIAGLVAIMMAVRRWRLRTGHSASRSRTP